MGRVSFFPCTATRAKAIQNRSSAIHRKAVIAEQTSCKMCGIVASEVLDGTADHAFSVKMVAAIARGANVLVDAAIALGAVEFTNDIRLAKLGKMAIDTASTGGCIPVDRKTDLLGCELSIRILGKKAANARASRCFVGLFFHTISPLFSNLRTILKL